MSRLSLSRFHYFIIFYVCDCLANSCVNFRSKNTIRFRTLIKLNKRKFVITVLDISLWSKLGKAFGKLGPKTQIMTQLVLVLVDAILLVATTYVIPIDCVF